MSISSSFIKVLVFSNVFFFLFFSFLFSVWFFVLNLSTGIRNQKPNINFFFSFHIFMCNLIFNCLYWNIISLFVFWCHFLRWQLKDTKLSGQYEDACLGILQTLIGLDNLRLLGALELQHQSLVKCDISTNEYLPVFWIPQLVAFNSCLEAHENNYLCMRIQLTIFDMIARQPLKHTKDIIILGSRTNHVSKGVLPPIETNGNLLMRWLAYITNSAKMSCLI